MKKTYNILILSNMYGSGLFDDTIVKDAFESDGHTADLRSVDYDESLDAQYDVIIRRNTWVGSEAQTAELHINNTKLIARLKDKGKKTVNILGLDGQGKGYLCDLFKAEEAVIPTIKSMVDRPLLPDSEKYVIKDIKSFGNGYFQRIVDADKLESEYTEGNIIQPFMKFKSEVQCYYVGEKLMYAFEYTPSKFPNYPEPTLIELTAEQKHSADHFAKYSQLECGFQRIDFLKLQDDSLMLMEIEDHAGFMNLQRLPTELCGQVMEEYKKGVYALIES